MATHAAGVVIAGDKLAEQFPLYIDHSSNLTLPSTQYDMYSSENAGLVKFDLLGLKTLTVIDKTIKRLRAQKINLDITKINQNDEKVFHYSLLVKQLDCSNLKVPVCVKQLSK